jgi:3-isopropylmalate dehydrogenase
MERNARPTMLVLPGDGIGPEVVRQAVRVLEFFGNHRDFDCTVRHEEFGVAEWYRAGKFMRDDVREAVMTSDAVLMGAVGGDAEHRAILQDIRRNEGVPGLRRQMQVYANIRPVKVFAAMAGASSLRPEIIENVDLIVVRELTGGIYFGTPRGIETLPDGQRRGVNTHVYTTSEIRRIGRAAFDLARARAGHVTSVDKANVMEAGMLWREEIDRLHQEEFSDIKLDHLYVDNCAAQINRIPRRFDVIVTDNLFGDILSDAASTIVGSLGMLPSASLGDPDEFGHRRGLYEPVHGSAPDIAGAGKANPIATILSLAMALEMTYHRPDDARLIEQAVAAALAQRKRTADIAEAGAEIVSTAGMGDAVLEQLHRLTL